MNAVHLHVSVLDFLIVVAYMLIASFLWRALAGKLADKPIGRAMGALL